MLTRRLLLGAGLAAIGSSSMGTPTLKPRPDWQQHFAQAQASGCIVVLDGREPMPKLQVYNPERAQTRYAPASTFKVFHSLFALDAGLIKDEFQVIPWDGKTRPNSNWNRDQTLRSAMRYSTVWVYERLAQQLGPQREADYLRRINYGNGLVSGAQPFWIEGDLALSAYEQLTLLQGLYRNTLPFKIEHQRLVKDVLINEADFDSILRAKTGWTGKLGWWVGWVEWPEGPVFFALNIDTPQREADLDKRQSITRAILQSIQALAE